MLTSGKEVILEIFGPGDPIGPLCSEGRYRLSARHSATSADWLTPFFRATALTRSTTDSGR